MALIDSIRRALVPATPPLLELTEVPAQKAALGRGAWVMEHGTPLNYGRVDTPRFMKEAQRISHKSPWVATAERVVSGKLATVPWHLEDRDGEEIEDTGTGPVSEFRRLMERPNPRTTRRVLWQITSRHLGVCGNAFWYLDQSNALTNAPLSIYYINPARMTPAQDKNGNLTGWVLDQESEYDWGTGVPLDLEEVLHFVFEPPDWGHLGHGLVESALSKIAIQKFGDIYAADLFAGGGKRGGIASAKDGILPPEVFDGLVSSFRNVAEAPDATKRTIVTQGAVDYTFTSATPSDLDLDAMLTMSRDDTLGIWGVPLSQTGIMAARGLNSGETVKYEEAALWQGAIHTRVMALWETVQYQLIDRIDPDWQLVIEEPTFDDQEPLFKLADMAKTQPLTFKERRAIMGLEPFGDERDEEVWLPKGFVRIFPEDAETPEPAVVPPPPPAPGSVVEDQQEAEDDSEETTRKASVSPLAAFRSKMDDAYVPDIRKAVESLLTIQKGETITRLRARAKHLIQKPKDTMAVLGAQSSWDAAFAKVLLPQTSKLAEATASEVRKAVPKAKKADPFEETAIDYVRTRGGERITGINATTRAAVEEAVQDVLEDAIADGLGPDEVSDLLTDRIGSLAVWDEARADLIARTETMFAYNEAALTSYRELDVGQVTALDGDQDPECASRNGQTFSIDDAFSIADHPNGTLDWIPVVKASLAPEPMEFKATMPDVTVNPVINMPDIHLDVPEQSAPIINVEPPIVNVDTAPFTAAVKAMRDEMARPRTAVHRKIVRDDAGLIVAVIEQDEEHQIKKRIVRDGAGLIVEVIEE